MCDLGLHFVAKSNYFSNTQTSHTRPIIDGVRSSVAYSTIEVCCAKVGLQCYLALQYQLESGIVQPNPDFTRRTRMMAVAFLRL